VSFFEWWFEWWRFAGVSSLILIMVLIKPQHFKRGFGVSVNQCLMLKVIQNSGGRSSAYMTEMLLKNFPDQEYLILFQNTGREKDQTLDFLNNCDKRWLDLYGIGITWLQFIPKVKGRFEVVTYDTAHRIADSKKSPFEKLIENQRYLPNRVARYCTRDLKIRVAENFIKSLGYKEWVSYIGIRYDEPKRWMNAKSMRELYTVEWPMVEWQTTKQDVEFFWKGMPFDLELKSYEGNCDLCFLKGIGKTRRIIRENPNSADWWIRMESLKEGTFRKGISYSEIVEGIKTAPEFQFRNDFECDIDCSCFID
jgi:hypothetical protein